MDIRCCVRFAGAAACLIAFVAPHLVFGQEPEAEWRRMLKASEPEQTAWIKSHLQAGMPGSSVFTMLILNRSEIALPPIEQKIEEVLHSPSPTECFSGAAVDPQKFVGRAAMAITEAGNIRSLKEASKLIRIDEKRFGWMVEGTLLQARSYGNPFTLAYLGFELGDPAVASRITAWVQDQLADKGPPPTYPGAAEGAEAVTRERRGLLAGALVARYGDVPTEKEWADDPIISRLPSANAALLHDGVMRAAIEVMQKRMKR
jgi:hypothetical protein